MDQISRSDITVFDRHGQMALMAEVKALSGTSKEWAAQYRSNLAADHFVPKVPFFLIATRDRFYLWKNPPDTGIVIDPDYEIDPKELLDQYFKRSNLDSQTVMGAAFELIVCSWLSELQRGIVANGAVEPHNRWLKESGLLETLRGGRLVLEAAAEP